MSQAYARDWLLPYASPTDEGLFADLEKVLRLCPQWDVMNVAPAPDGGFELLLNHDRLEAELAYHARVREHVPGARLGVTLTRGEESIAFDFSLEDRRTCGVLRARVETVPPPKAEDVREFDLWARSLANYLAVSRSRSPAKRAWKWFLDRWWLKMSQSGKRMAFFILMGEALSVVFLVFILLWWKFFP
jgi:hypothetical protein